MKYACNHCGYITSSKEAIKMHQQIHLDKMLISGTVNWKEYDEMNDRKTCHYFIRHGRWCSLKNEGCDSICPAFFSNIGERSTDELFAMYTEPKNKSEYDTARAELVRREVIDENGNLED